MVQSQGNISGEPHIPWCEPNLVKICQQPVFCFYRRMYCMYLYTYVGSTAGMATQMKLALHMISGSVTAAVSEGMALAERIGINQKTLADALSSSAAGSELINNTCQGLFTVFLYVCKNILPSYFFDVNLEYFLCFVCTS